MKKISLLKNKKIRIVLLLLLVSILGIVGFLKTRQAEAAWYGTAGWSFRKKLVIDYTKVSGAQVNFPVLVSITDSDLQSLAQSTGNDILFTSSDGTTKLDHEIEKYTSSNGTLVAWVRIPALSASVDTEIYMYYGNGTASSQQNKTGVWDSNYVGVWHLSETTGNHTNSTSTAGLDQDLGSVTQQGANIGKVDGADEFNGTSDFVRIPHVEGMLPSSDMTLESWSKLDTLPSVAGHEMDILIKGAGSQIPYSFRIASSTNKVRFVWLNSSITEYPGSRYDTALTTGTWMYTVGVHDSSLLRFYFNGSATGTTTDNPTGTIYNTSPGPLRIGLAGAGDNGFDGIVDEVRLSSIARSAGWIATTYNTINSPSTFFKSKSLAQKGPSTPVLSWSFNEASGTTANDSSPYANSGTLGVGSSAPVWNTVSSIGGGASLQFDGTNDYVSKAYANDAELDPGNNSLAVDLWFNHPSAISGTDTLISRASGTLGSEVGYKIYMNSSGYMCFGIDDTAGSFPEDSACSTVSYADSNWHHLEAVKNSTSSITLYIDGVQVFTNTNTGSDDSISGTTPTFYVGMDSDGSSNPWTGFIDEVRVFDSLRTASEVKTDFGSRGSVRGITASFGDNQMSEKLNEGLMGYWKMDENTGATTADASGNTNTGNLGVGSSAPAWSSGRFGSGLTFDGSNDYVQVTQTSGLPVYRNTGYSVAFWIKGANNTDDDRNVFAEASSTTTNPIFGILKNASNSHLVLYIRDDSANVLLPLTYSSTAVYDSTWHHVVWVDNNGTATLYVDGIKDTTNFNYTPSTLTLNRTAIGAKIRSTPSAFFNGSLDELRTYSRVLSPTEVRALYEWAPGPVGYWKMDETASPAVDSSGNSNSGTWVGNTTFSTGKFGNAANFDGTNGYINAGNNSSLSITGPVTVCSWTKADSLAGTAPSLLANFDVNANAQYALGAWPTGEIYFEWANLGNFEWYTTSAGTITTGRWYHICGVRISDSNVKIYIDGVEKSTTVTGDYSIPTSAGNTLISDDSTDFEWDGLIDEVRIYNYARSAKQIIQDMSARGGSAVGGNAGSSTAIAHYKFDEGADNTCSGGSNDACNSGNGGIVLDGAQTNMAVPATAASGWNNSGKFGKALSFDGTDDVVTVTNSTPIDLNEGLASSFSISAWIYADSDGESDTGQIFYKGANTYLRVSGESGNNLNIDARVDLATLDATKSLTAPITKSSWNHIVMMWTDDNDDELTLYVNGKNMGSSTDGDGAPVAESNNLLIGGTTTANFDGMIDDFKVYSYELSEDEVKVDYNQGKSTSLGALGTSTTYQPQAANQQYCIPGDTTSCAPPVGEWNFDENTGTTANDISGNANSLTLTNFPTWTNGKFGAAIAFAGSDAHLIRADDSDFDFADDASITYATWFKHTTASTQEVILSKYNEAGYKMIMESDGDITCALDYDSTWSPTDSITSTAATYDDNNWHYLACVKSGASNLSLYIDGVLIGSDASLTADNTLTNSDPLYLGIDANGTSNDFTGKLDNTKIFNYARTPAQIAYDYNRGAPVAWYKFDECTGVTVNDWSPNSNGGFNGNNGTITIGASGTQDTAGTCTGDSSEGWYNGVTGKWNSSLNFDGTDDYVSLPATTELDLTEYNPSISVWFKTSSSSDQIIYNDYYSDLTPYISIGIDSSGYYWGGYRDSGLNMLVASSEKVVNDGNWHHGVFVKTGDTSVSVYLDGVLQSNESNPAFSNPSFAGGVTPTIGINAGYSNTPFSGQIDDFRIYKYTLTAQQVKTLYNNGSAVSFR